MTAPDVAIFLALKGLVPVGASFACYPETFPEPPRVPVWPAIRYQEVSIDPTQDVCGTDDGSTDDTFMQIEYAAKTKGAAKLLRAQGRAALMAVTDPPCLRGNGSTDYDPVTDTYRAIDDYTFHPSSGS